MTNEKSKKRYMISDGCFYYTLVAQNKEEAKNIYEKKFGIAYPNNFFICLYI